MADITFARSEVPVAFASASKPEQISIIENGSISYFTAEAKLRSKMTNADQSEWIEIGREEGLQIKQIELQPQLRELETLRLQYNLVLSVKDSLQGQLYVRDTEENSKIIKIEEDYDQKLGEIKSKLEDTHEKEIAKLKKRMEDELEEKAKQKSEQLSYEEKKKADALEYDKKLLQQQLELLKEKNVLSTFLIEQNQEKDTKIQELQDTINSLQEVKPTPNSQHLGAEGEETVRTIMDEALCHFKGYRVDDTHSQGHEGDLSIYLENSKSKPINFQVDSKNSAEDDARIKKTECDKSKRDVDGRTQCNFGLFIVHRGRIDGGIQHLEMEKSNNNKLIVYLIWKGFTKQQKIQSIKDVVSILIETVSDNENDKEEHVRISNLLKKLKKNHKAYVEDAIKMANTCKKAWEEAEKLVKQLSSDVSNFSSVDDEIDGEVISTAQRGRGRARGRGRGT